MTPRTETPPPLANDVLDQMAQGWMQSRWSREAAARLRYLETAHVELIAALKLAEFDCRMKCSVCAGWNCSPNGETPKAHTKTCAVGMALSRLSPLPAQAAKDGE